MGGEMPVDATFPIIPFNILLYYILMAYNIVYILKLKRMFTPRRIRKYMECDNAK